MMIGGVSMSILGKVIEFVASDAIVDALDVPIKALNRASKKLDAKNKGSKKKLFEKQPGTEVLVLNQQRFTWRNKFDVYDEYESVKYSVKGEFSSIKHHLHIYDANSNEIGSVKEKLISLRSPLSLESDPKDFIFEIGGKKIGTMKSKWAFGKQKYEVDFNGWQIEGNVLGWKYKILEGKNEVANISQQLLYFGDTYIIGFSDKRNELIILMLVLALDVANAPKKSEEFKNTLHHKSHYWL